ncbi:MAG: hypothetical protein ACO2O2_04895 [Acidilobaceae archaeon]
MAGGVLRRFLGNIVSFIRAQVEGFKEGSVSAIRLEHNELEAAFLNMILGPLVGVVTGVPPVISLELLAELGDEVRYLESRAFRGEDVIGDLFSTLSSE